MNFLNLAMCCSFLNKNFYEMFKFITPYIYAMIKLVQNALCLCTYIYACGWLHTYYKVIKDGYI